jgi:hypothetical protein
LEGCEAAQRAEAPQSPALAFFAGAEKGGDAPKFFLLKK